MASTGAPSNATVRSTFPSSTKPWRSPEHGTWFIAFWKEGDLPDNANCAMLAGYVAVISQGLAVRAKAGVSRDTLLAIVGQVVDTWPS